MAEVDPDIVETIYEKFKNRVLGYFDKDKDGLISKDELKDGSIALILYILVSIVIGAWLNGVEGIIATLVPQILTLFGVKKYMSLDKKKNITLKKERSKLYNVIGNKDIDILELTSKLDLEEKISELDKKQAVYDIKDELTKTFTSAMDDIKMELSQVKIGNELKRQYISMLDGKKTEIKKAVMESDFISRALE